MTRAACLEITNGYYDTVPAFPRSRLLVWERGNVGNGSGTDWLKD